MVDKVGVLFFALFATCHCSDVVLQTKLGAIRGNVIDFVDTISGQHKAINEFRGIRYGKAPVGPLRFRRPEPEPRWEECGYVYDARHYGNSCLQNPIFDIDDDILQSEDCLFLNVWTPAIYRCPVTGNKKLPVMVWIHGGGLYGGSATYWKYSGEQYSAIGDVVFVSFNYRLNTLGFLYSGLNDSDNPGNMGHYDQILGLKWIKENIADFGGDPNHVTIFGNSAGAWSVNNLILSPLATGLFHRAILQSGAISSGYPDPRTDPVRKAAELAEAFGCLEKGKQISAETLECLRQQDARELVTRVQIGDPVYGTEILPARPTEAFESGQLNNGVDLIFGALDGEANGIISKVFPDKLGDVPANITKAEAKQIMRQLFTKMNFEVSQADEVYDFYIDSLQGNNPELIRWRLGQSVSDATMICPVVIFGRNYADFSLKSRIFSYIITHRPAVPWAEGRSNCAGWMGVCHAEDNQIILGAALKRPQDGYSADDQRLSRDIITAWTNFAKFGNPGTVGGVQWLNAVDYTNLMDASVRYLELNPNSYRMVENAYRDSCETFWRPFTEEYGLGNFLLLPW